jgi:hypothetical protein
MVEANAGIKAYRSNKKGLNPDAQLTGSMSTLDTLPEYSDFLYIPLFEAVWPSKADFDSSLQRLVAIRLHKMPREAGGNCIDFMAAMIHLLKDEGRVTRTHAFDSYKDAHYDTVTCQTWGRIVLEDERLSRAAQRKKRNR